MIQAIRRWWLERRGRRVWLDVADLPPGQYYLWFAVMQGGTVVSDDPKPWPPATSDTESES